MVSIVATVAGLAVLLLVHRGIRRWFDRALPPGDSPPAWWAGPNDPVVPVAPSPPPASPLAAGACPACGGPMLLQLAELGRWEAACDACGRTGPPPPRASRAEPGRGSARAAGPCRPESAGRNAP
jgi:hypothetical protein